MSITKLDCMELKDTRYSVYPYDGYNLEEILGKFYEAIKECNDLSFSLQEFNNWIIDSGLVEEVEKQLNKVDWDNIVNSELYQKVIERLLNTNNRIEEVKNELSSQLEHIATICELKTNIENNSEILNKCILSGGEITLPCNGTFILNQTININNPVHIDGNNSTLIFNCDNGFNITSNGVTLTNINIKQNTLDHEKSKTGLMFGKYEDSKYKYISNIKLENVNISDFTVSLHCESVYWIELNNLTTFRDKEGIVFNQHPSSDNNPTTTLKIDRVYLKGSGNIFNPHTDSKGFNIKNIVSLSVNMFACEWYSNCGEFNTIQAGTIISPYFELCSLGVKLHNITGNVTLIDTYINKLGKYGIKFEYGGITVVGGRAIFETSTPIFSKGANSHITIVKKVNGVNSTDFESNGYQNAGIVNIDNGLKTYDTTINGLECNNQGYRKTSYKFGEISTNLNDLPINIKIGDVNVGKFTSRGLEMNQLLHLYLKDLNGLTYKIEVDANTKQLKATQV